MLFCFINEKWNKMKVGFIKKVRMFILWIFLLGVLKLFKCKVKVSLEVYNYVFGNENIYV